MAKKRVNLEEREDAASMLRRVMPTRIRIAVAVYDAEPPGVGVTKAGYRQLPDHARIIGVRTQRELRRLWRALEDVLTKGDWKDEQRRSVAGDPGDRSGDVADLGETD